MFDLVTHAVHDGTGTEEHEGLEEAVGERWKIENAQPMGPRPAPSIM